MGSKVRQLLGTLAPIAASFIPGVGPLLGAAIGAGGGLLSGGGLRGALTGGLSGGLLTGGGSLLGNALAGAGTTLGGATGLGAGATALGSGLLGAGAGASAGGLRGALLGGAAGGLGGYANAGGFSGLGSSLGLTGENSLFGTAAGTPLANGAQGATQGTGLLGTATRSLSGLGSALSSGTGGGDSAYGGGSSYAPLGAIAGGINSLNANDKAQKDLIDAQNRSIAQFQPYLDSGTASNKRLSELLGTGGDTNSADYGSLSKPFTPGDLTQDPSYKFQLEQGTNAINRSLGAKGQLFSGSALKAAQDYGTGLADQTYKDAYARYTQNQNDTYNKYAGQSGQGQAAAGAASGAYQNIGAAKANSGIASSGILNQTLSSLLSGSGAKRFLGYGQNGQPIYV